MPGLINITEKNWAVKPREARQVMIPAFPCETPIFIKSAVMNVVFTIMSIKYSSAASIIYEKRLVRNCFSDFSDKAAIFDIKIPF